MSGMMLHGLGDCTPRFHCGCGGLECEPKRGWLSGEAYCATHGRAAGWPCREDVGVLS